MTGQKLKINLVTVNLGKMTKQRRQFTPEEKYSILQEAEREGLTETARKYNIAHSVLHYWKKKYLSMGKNGLKAAYKRIEPEVRELEEENARLKRIIAKQALEIEVKTEVIKKSQAHLQKGRRL
jgi:transposase-like protein